MHEQRGVGNWHLSLMSHRNLWLARLRRGYSEGVPIYGVRLRLAIGEISDCLRFFIPLFLSLRPIGFAIPQ
ncbi:hypothetical protein XHV734_0750 [Xanthomonas hortorum pv. vitians]|nr:hypothetical protein XHV734_0750 [Xanthomonas hortorum pv. vitians]